MNLAELGVERTAFHSTLHACEGGAPMSPICARGTLEEPGQIVGGRTSYLALMILGDLPNGRVLNPTVSGAGKVSVHAVLGDGGELIVLESTAPPGATERMAQVILEARPEITGEANLPNSLYFSRAPERVLPGRIMIEMFDNDRIIGGMTRRPRS